MSGFGRALRLLRWPVLIGWVITVVALHPLAAHLYQVTDDGAAANLPSSAPSTQVAALQDGQRANHDQVGTTSDDSIAVVIARDGGLTADDDAAVSAARQAVARLAGSITGLGPPGPALTAPDGRAVVFTAEVSALALDKTGTDTAATTAVRRAVEAAVRGSEDGLRVAVTGGAAITADGGHTSQTTLLLTALLIVAAVLLVVYRSVLLWVFPLLGALGGIVLAQAMTHLLGNAGVTVSSLSTSILIVLAFGAASDYALLLIHRYRDELSRHAAAEDAMAAALRGTLPTLLASAGTVVGAMLCLLAARSASLHGLGPIGAVAIASALLAQVTFLPALLLIAGRAAFWPRRPRFGQIAPAGSRAWSAVGAGIARRPIVVAVGAVVLLAAACLGLLSLHTDDDPLANLKGEPESVAGAQLFAQHFGAGADAPLIVLSPPAQAAGVAAAARSVPGVAAVTALPPVQGWAASSITLTVDPYGTAGSTAVAGLRDRLDRDAPGSLVGGDPAIRYDIDRAAARDERVLIPLVLGVIFVVVALLLRSLVAPLILVSATALSFGASFGLANLLWRHAFGFSGVESQLPLYIFVFLVALGVDYGIFLAARIREESREIGTRAGTLRGLAVTGGVITAAGIVLAGTFAALVPGPLVDLAEVGTAIALGVLLDTLLVRPVVVPALFLALGERVWWPARRRTGQPAAVAVPGATWSSGGPEPGSAQEPAGGSTTVT